MESITDPTTNNDATIVDQQNLQVIGQSNNQSSETSPGTSAVATPATSNRPSRQITPSTRPSSQWTPANGSWTPLMTPNRCSAIHLARVSSAQERSNRRARYQLRTWVFFAIIIFLCFAIARVTHICMDGVYEYEFESHPILRIVNKICSLK